jgi:hypothetical protein
MLNWHVLVVLTVVVLAIGLMVYFAVKGWQ